MLALRLEGHTYRCIASKAGLTHQRIHQILSSLPFTKREKQSVRTCLRCGQPCNTPQNIFCSKACAGKGLKFFAEVPCSYCRKRFPLIGSEGKNRIKRSQSGLMFCSRTCKGKWLGHINKSRSQ